MAAGAFDGSPWDLGISGGFASPGAAALLAEADLVVALGASLSMWTTRHGRLIGPGATVAQVDDDPSALGAHQPVSLAALGDVAATVDDLSAVAQWREAGCPGPLLLHARVVPTVVAEWLEESFRGH